MKKRKKYFMKFAALTAAVCSVTLFMNPNVFAENTAEENEDSVLTNGGQGEFEILEWEIGNIGMDDEIQTEDTGSDSYGIMAYTSYYDIPGTWIQEPDGR